MWWSRPYLTSDRFHWVTIICKLTGNNKMQFLVCRKLRHDIHWFWFLFDRMNCNYSQFQRNVFFNCRQGVGENMWSWKGKAIGQWRTLHTEGLHDFHSPDGIRVINQDETFPCTSQGMNEYVHKNLVKKFEWRPFTNTLNLCHPNEERIKS
jgi:hypothetical protein